MLSSNELLFLHLFLIKGVGPSLIIALFKKAEMMGYAFSDLYNFSVSDFVNLVGLKEGVASIIKNGLSDKRRLNDEIQLAEEKGIKILTYCSKFYPYLLKEIAVPPPVFYLWSRGRIDDLDFNKGLAVVGSRRADQYSTLVLRCILPSLVHSGWLIVSGGAIGADSMAHRITMDNGGKTVAVLGSGLLSPYPFINVNLFEDIIAKGGALASIFPLKAKAERWNFPVRNRVISGLCKGVLVLQATRKSGALITAAYGLEQNRLLFAVPGVLSNDLSEGPHLLIKNGAKLVERASDILEEFDDFTGSGYEGRENEGLQKNNSVEKFGDKKLFALLSQKAMSLEEIAFYYEDLPEEDLSERLFSLQLKGQVRQNAAGFWELC